MIQLFATPILCRFLRMTQKKQPPSYPLRLPPELRSKLEAAAERGYRPLSMEIIKRLDESFAPIKAMEIKRETLNSHLKFLSSIKAGLKEPIPKHSGTVLMRKINEEMEKAGNEINNLTSMIETYKAGQNG